MPKKEFFYMSNNGIGHLLHAYLINANIKKIVSAFVGLEKYGCDLADVAKKMSEKFGTGAADMIVEYKELN
jgi:translation initiation factor 1 (eIF-1/SUI1)